MGIRRPWMLLGITRPWHHHYRWCFMKRTASIYPTVDEINALPEKVRRYIHDLVTRCDKSGDVQTIAILREGHRAHLPEQLVKSDLARKISNADDLMGHAQRLLEEAERMARKAESEGSVRLVLLAIAEQRNVLKLCGEVMGEIRSKQEHTGVFGVQLIHSIPSPDRSRSDRLEDRDHENRLLRTAE